MNTWALVILTALLVEYGVEGTANALNIRALSPEVPEAFRDVYDVERYRQAQEYARARTRFGMLGTTIDLALLLAFWLAGGFHWLDGAVRGLALGAIPSGLVFIGSLALGRGSVSIPLRWWATFVIEERFGFNRTTPRTFWIDLGKGFALSALLGGTLLAAVLWLLAEAGSWAWLWCWLASAAFLVGVQFVAPTWILPLFNRWSPLAPGELREAILAYARSVAFPLSEVFMIDGSRRSTKANAFFTGFGGHKRVALFDTLVEKLQPDELVAVLAHEIGHYKRGHVWKGMVAGIVQMGLVFVLLSVLLRRSGLFEALGVVPSAHAGIVGFALVFSPLALGLSLVAHAWSRRHEREADAFAARTTGHGERLASALKRLSADSLSTLTPHPLYVLLYYAHPPVLERIRSLCGQGPALGAMTSASGGRAFD
jgi:STE24 endopeptidase